MDENTNKSEDMDINPLENDQLAQELSDTFDEPFDDLNNPNDFSNDDWDEEIESDFYEEDSPVQAPQKSQINWFNIGVFGFVGVAAIAIGYDQFIGSGSTPTPVTQQQAIAQSTSPQEKQNLAQQALSDAPNVPTSPQGFLGNPDLLADASNEEQVTKQNNTDNDLFAALDTPPSYEDDIEDILSTLKHPTAPEKNDIEEITEDTVDTLPLPSDVNIDVTPAPVLADAPVFESLSMEQPIEEIEVQDTTDDLTVNTPMPSVEKTIDEPTPGPSIDVTAISSQVETLNTRLNDLASRMDQMMDKLDNEPIMVAPTPAPNNAVISKLESTIATLEKRVETLSKEAKKAPVKKRAAKTVAKKKAAPKVSKPKIVWELRGASPDQAYVAQRGTQNLRTIAVGENLDGVGRITSIAIENNRWVVRGTSGIITQ